MDFKDQKKDIAEDAFLWEVEATDDAEQDIDNFVFYLLIEKMNEQAAKAVMDDFDETIEELATVAGILKLVDNPRLRELGYRKIRFRRHDYYLLYRLEGHTAVVDHVYHDLQDIDGVL